MVLLLTKPKVSVLPDMVNTMCNRHGGMRGCGVCG